MILWWMQSSKYSQIYWCSSEIGSTCRLHNLICHKYTCANRWGNVKINRKLYGDNPGHTKFNSCQIIFRLRNVKVYSHQNVLIYSSQLLSVMAINRKPTDVLLQNWCRNNSWCVQLLWYWNNKVLISQIYATSLALHAIQYSTGGQCSLEYNTVLNVRRFHRVLHHVTFKVTQGKPGLHITKQISVECKVCTCVAMPCYKCLNYTDCWGEVGGRGGGGGGGGGQKNRQQVRSQLQRSDKQWNKKGCWGLERNLSKSDTVLGECPDNWMRA